MKQLLFLIGLCWLTNAAYAQSDKYNHQRELRGSGKVVQIAQTLPAFQAITIRPFLSDVTVETGGTQSTASVQLDDNFKPLLRMDVVDGVLTLDVKDPDNKPFWMSKGTIRVVVKTPSLNRLQNESNGNVTINGLTGDSFDLTNQGNGTITLRGSVTRFNVLSTANGDVQAQALTAQQANVVTQANATVTVNARQVHSTKSANASIRNVAGTQNRSAVGETGQQATPEKLVTVILQNNSPASRTVTLRFTEPGNPVYGVVSTTLGPYAKRRETYPVGTKIEQLSSRQQQLAMSGGDVPGKLIVTLKNNDNGQTYNLPD